MIVFCRSERTDPHLKYCHIFLLTIWRNESWGRRMATWQWKEGPQFPITTKTYRTSDTELCSSHSFVSLFWIVFHSVRYRCAEMAQFLFQQARPLLKILVLCPTISTHVY